MKKRIKERIIKLINTQIEIEKKKSEEGIANDYVGWTNALNEINNLITTSEERNNRAITKEEQIHFKCWLIQNDLTIKEFAQKCGCSRQYIEKVINGKCKITEHIRNSFAKGDYTYF